MTRLLDFMLGVTSGAWLIYTAEHWGEMKSELKALIKEAFSFRGAEPAAASVTDSENTKQDSAVSPELLPTQLPKEPQQWPCPNCGKPLYDSGDHGIIHVHQADQCTRD